MLLHNIANCLYQKWLGSFSFSNHPIQRHLALFTRRITGQVAESKEKEETQERVPPKNSASATPIAITSTITGEETATLLSLIHMLRRKSAPLMELIRIAEDVEADAIMVEQGNALPSATTFPAPPRPSFARITAPCSLPDFNVLHPYVAAPQIVQRCYPALPGQMGRRHHRQRSRSRSRSCLPEDLDSQPDRLDKPPTFHEENGTEESRRPRYAWPYWYEWTENGVVRGRCSP